MVSTTVGNIKPTKSKAADFLAFAIGKRSVQLSKLSKKELTELLAERIEGIDFRDLRGFSEVRDILGWHADEWKITVPPDVKIGTTNEFDQFPFDLKSHVIGLQNPLIASGRDTWRQYETNKEKTENWMGFSMYRREGAYLCRFERSILALRRVPNNLPCASQAEALVELTTRYVKKPQGNEYVANSILVTRIPVANFCKYFGKHAGTVAHAIIYEMASAHERTVKDLESLVRRAQESAAEWRRLSKATG
jgi:hypothetical protein